MEDPVSYKNLLQECLQKRAQRLPHYADSAITREDGTFGFRSRVTCDLWPESCEGEGGSKREAQQAAAKKMYSSLLENDWNERRTTVFSPVADPTPEGPRSNRVLARSLPRDDGGGRKPLMTMKDGGAALDNDKREEEEEIEDELTEVCLLLCPSPIDVLT